MSALGPQQYEPEIWQVEKDTIYAAIPAVESGMEYARECLSNHDYRLGRTTRKNRVWAERMESDIRQMEGALAMLRACRAPGGAVPDTSRGTLIETALRGMLESFEIADAGFAGNPIVQGSLRGAFLREPRRARAALADVSGACSQSTL